ncbi:nucleotidyltransferase [Bacillus inaquosorum]|uniref:nucleotidyltransferase domain-containing protein n=1 Tax=Bacillus inaquosorum TaxID=483913 RepID=UPI00227F222A|nr:nucleotidyltransferase [Bacillus inaquosorum]MCY8696398.1 nucleotidyltransferase [Bacillus inaquosorum]
MERFKENILKTLLDKLDLPETAYEKAKKRYEDLGEWFNREDSSLKENKVHIFPQGSFLLGTAIRPISNKDEYDLDLACKLRYGVSESTHSQKQLKEIIGTELQKYIKYKGITTDLISKHRCWRIEYKDTISFHLDIVPAIPATDVKKQTLFESMQSKDTDKGIAQDASNTALFITDDRDPSYDQKEGQWNISNPQGYGIWFKTQMRTLELRAKFEAAEVEDLPINIQKTPLQRCIQLLKRHRDIMFKDDESKPISIIITTLAAKAYAGESNVYTALNNILEAMPQLINSSLPRVPNPVNPEEDFADRWGMEAYNHLRLEDNFNMWLKQAQIDFSTLTTSTNLKELNEITNMKFYVSLEENEIHRDLGFNSINKIASLREPKKHIIQDPAKPWNFKLGE